jgi:hypothetical protein
MNKIDKLTKKYCLNGVEFRELSDIADVVREKRLTKSQLNDDGKYAVYHGWT